MRPLNSLLVTGGAGFIGSAFIRNTLQNPNFQGQIINVDKLSYAANLDNLKTVEDHPNYHFYQADITDLPTLTNIALKHSIDTIVHFAAESHVDRSISGPEAFLESNVIGTFILLELVKKFPHIHFHHVSTDEVFGSLGPEGAFCETTPYNPNSPYSASKAASDHFVRAYAHTYNLSTTLSNCSNNYGPYQYPEKLIPLMIQRCLKHETLPVYGQGNNVRDWLFVDDHTDAIWEILHKAAPNTSYNVGGGYEISNLELVHTLIEKIAEKTEQDPHTLKKLIKHVEDRKGHDFRYAMNISKIQKELNWSPKHSFSNALDLTIDWYLENSPLSVN